MSFVVSELQLVTFPVTSGLLQAAPERIAVVLAPDEEDWDLAEQLEEVVVQELAKFFLDIVPSNLI
jgi:hypothetical protein